MKNKRTHSKAVSTGRTTMTWVLISIWVLLISFGVMSALDPDWLKKLSSPGVENESLDYKNFGDDFLVNGNYRLAITNYERALEIKPEFPDVVVNMGIAFIRLGYEKEGVQSLRRALKMKDCNKGVIYFALAEVLEKQEKFNDAISFYYKALDTSVEEHHIYKKIASIYLHIKEYDKAIENYELALVTKADITLSYKTMLEVSLRNYKDDSTNSEIIKNQLEQVISADDLEIYDLDIIRRGNQTDPVIAKIHDNLGVINTILGDSTKAVEHFKYSLQVWPANKNAKAWLAKIQDQAN